MSISKGHHLIVVGSVSMVMEVAEASNSRTLPSFHFPRQHNTVRGSSWPGLNGVFQPIRCSLLSRETLPDVKDAFAIISKEESHRGIASSSSGSVSKPQVSGFIGPNPNSLCKNYGNVGHTIDRCFDLIGYPPGYNKNFGPKQNGFKSFNANTASTSNENGTRLSFINEHMMKLMNLINEVPSKNMQANIPDLHQNKTMGTDSNNGGLYLFDTPYSFSFNCQTLALGRLLKEIHVTWAHLEKKRTRLRLYTNYFEEKHTLRGDGVANFK
ncbi:hypothetical protein Tco_1247433 [Tanacetum coccineum]